MQTSVDAHGARIPLVGLGTWELRGRTCARVVEQALRLGYRHIDTAQIYENEREVGEGLRAAGVRRSEIFLTTKIWPTHFAPREFERAAKERLVHLRVTEVDLLLLHWPNPHVPLAETMGALLRMQEIGLTRHIGISNFNSRQVAEAIELSGNRIVAHQFEMHPFLDQTTLVKISRAAGIAVVAYSPIARGAAKGDTVLARIGAAHGKSAAQISLRFLVQQDIAVIPRTSRIERLSENIDLFDFALSDADMDEIRTLARPDGRVVDFAFAGEPDWD